MIGQYIGLRTIKGKSEILLWNLEGRHPEDVRPPDFGVVNTLELGIVKCPEEVATEFLEGLLEALVELCDVVVAERHLFRGSHLHQQVSFAECHRPHCQFLMRHVSVVILCLNRIEDGVDIFHMFSEGADDRRKDNAVTHDVELVNKHVELLAPVAFIHAILVNPNDHRERSEGTVQSFGRQVVKRRESH